MKTLFLSTAAFLIATTMAFAGVKNGDTGNGAPHGTVTMNSKGGSFGDYKVTFTDDVGTSSTTIGTPTPGGEPGEVDDSGWSTTKGVGEDGKTIYGGTYRVYNGKLQKQNKDGKPVDCGPAPNTGIDANTGPITDQEGTGTLPCPLMCGSDNEAVGTLPCFYGGGDEAVGTLPCDCFHVPVPRPTDKPKGDKPPKLEKKPLPPV
jgi:hypothetical protein